MAAKKTKKGSTKNVLLAGAAAAGVAAAVAGYYFYGPKGKQRREKIRGWSLKAHGEVMERIEKLTHIDKETYNQIVDDVAKKYSKVKGIAAKEIASFAKDVKAQWQHPETTTKKKPVRKTRKTARKK
jgi:gas vesicle protein